jgi:hypothetical protein
LEEEQRLKERFQLKIERWKQSIDRKMEAGAGQRKGDRSERDRADERFPGRQ